MKHLFIVNPVAGGKDHTMEIRARAANAMEQRPGEDWEVYVTQWPMDASRKIRLDAAYCDHLRVYACGGDGTFNECVNGAALLEHVAVCPFPTGTGNDFCRMFGEDKDLFRDLDALLAGREVPIDLILCNGRYSANICSVGIDARIGTSVHKYSRIPLVGGAASYVVSAAVNMFKGISSQMRIRCGDFQAEAKHSLVCACNGRFYGGGFNPSLDARPDDGIMEIFVAKKVNLFQFAALIGRYAKGQAEQMPKYITHLHTSQDLHIEFDAEDVVNVDGEAMFAESLTMRMVPKAMKLLIPRGLRFFDQAE